MFTVVAGAWTGTVSFYGSGDGGQNWAPLAVTPSNGGTPVTMVLGTGAVLQTFQANTSAYTHVCMLQTANTSGSVVVKIHLSPISARIGGGGGGGAGSASLSSLTAATTTPGALANGPNNLTWNWTEPAAGSGLTLGETAASTGGVGNSPNNQSILQVSTQPNSTATPLSISQGALSNAALATPALQIQSTWNNAGTSFNGIYENITNTMSANTSTLLNLSVGGANMFTVNPAGGATLNGTLNSGSVISSGFVSATANQAFRAAGFPALSAQGSSLQNIVVTGGVDNTLTSTLGGLLVKGAHNLSNAAGATAGSAILEGGVINNVTAGAAAMQGTVEMAAGYTKGAAIAALEDVVCGTATQYQVTDCPASALNAVGIAVSTANPVVVIVEGTVPVQLDNTATLGDLVCVSTTTAGKGHDNGAVNCAQGLGIGIVIATAGAVVPAPVGGGVSGTGVWPTVTLSTALPLVQLHFR